MSLGRWAVLDIETTGTNPATDEIIDLGFLQFEGCTLVKSYSSLVRAEHDVSSFISKLTGITNKALSVAPLWELVEHDLLLLEGHHLIAHNSSFEESFLSRYFEKYSDEEPVVFCDSLLFLALLFPRDQHLNLEHFLNKLYLSEKEEHRGLSDSRDLLKVLLLSVALYHEPDLTKSFPFHVEARLKLQEILSRFPEDYFFRKFFSLSSDDLYLMAHQIDFNLDESLKKFKEHFFVRREGTKDLEKTKDFSRDFSKENLQSLFQNENLMRKKIPHYKYRSSQEALSLRVGQSFKNQIHSLIQAPTGTGKTMGYLIPTVLFSLSEKKTCLIATGTKILQEQALSKDVPQVLKLMSLEDDFLIVKLIGSSNHFCELLFREEDEHVLIETFDETWVKAYFENLFYFNSKVSYDQKITREEVPYVLKKKMKKFAEKDTELAVDYKACAGGQCPLSKNCSYYQGLQVAKNAHVIIGNHSLMLNWPKSLERPEYIIVDEAHKLEHEATKAYSLEVSDQQLTGGIRNFPQGMGALIYLLSQESEMMEKNESLIEELRNQTRFHLQMLDEHVAALPTLMETWFKKIPSYTPAYFNELPYPVESSLKDPLTVSLFKKLESIQFILGNIVSLYAPYLERFAFKQFQDDGQKTKALALFENHFSTLEKLYQAFHHFHENPSDWCSFIKYHEQEGFFFVSSPINVGKKIHDELLAPSSSVVFTSATLGNSTGDLGLHGVEWMTGYCYLLPEKRFKKGFFLEANFNYQQQAKVFLSTDTRSISDPLFFKEMMKDIFPLIEEIKGKSLFLFSSKLRFQSAVEMILGHFKNEIPVFVQGLGKNVVEDFKKEEGAILIGMESFAEGIDIPGEKLSFIIIDKIPDVRQNLVIQKRRDFFESTFGNEFNDYFLAHRTRSLHQKFGRLIRTETDQGAILVVDNRVKRWKGKTLQHFKQMMLPYDVEIKPLREACQEIKAYFAQRN